MCFCCSFTILSGVAAIFWNLGGHRRFGELSAYSVFNPGQRALMGEMRAEDIDRELRQGRANHDNDDDDDGGGLWMPHNNFKSRNANKLCPCGSKKKTKKCCGRQ